ncbi:phage minor tail protein L [Suttonella ornithocola]|uniref:Phage minor tail protein L n=1 Tax=Suttonella ornithocola TaxID=279832 RepID=A0A380MTN3_9GAMM|nr:phage minor tail protein L [Suttonella ornithocola]SUO95283.1 phage minor tail protein L [Suttonella ornithocola]
MKDIRDAQAYVAPEQTALIALYEIDLTKVGGGITYFCPEVNEKGQSMKWKGREYHPYPIQAQGFEISGDGPAGRPTIAISNLLGWVTGAINEHDGIIGCQVIRKRVLAKHLDADNFINGNDDADPLAEVVDKWLINRMVSLNSKAATFELASPAEMDNAVIPARPILANVRPTLAELREKYGHTAVLPYMGFPSVNKRGG